MTISTNLSVPSTDAVNLRAQRAHAGIRPGQWQTRNCLPLAALGIEYLDRRQLGRAIRAANGVHLAVDHGNAEASARLAHSSQHLPRVRLGHVFVDGLEAFDAVVATADEERAVELGTADGALALLHRRQGAVEVGLAARAALVVRYAAGVLLASGRRQRYV